MLNGQNPVAPTKEPSSFNRLLGFLLLVLFPDRIICTTGQTAALLRHIFNTTADEKLRDVIHESGIRLKYVEGQFFAIDFVNRTILNLNAYGFDIKRLLPKLQHPQQVRQPSGHTKAPNPLRQRGGSTDTNREWEVVHSSYEVDDERTLKR